MDTRKTAIITGADGQDFFYLSSILLAKDYNVVGVTRRTNITKESFLKGKKYGVETKNLEIVYGDITDDNSIYYIIKKYQPDEFYNFAGFSHPGMSFDQPEITIDVNGVGVLRILENIKNHSPTTRFLQVSSPDIFAKTSICPQNEDTPPCPNSPYGISKLLAHNLVNMYRDVFGLFAVNAICYNHESPLRNPLFVTKKITSFVGKYSNNKDVGILKLGNLSSMRDWGHAEDYCWGMYLSLQHDTSNNYLFATGSVTSVRRFCEMAFRYAGYDIIFDGNGINEFGCIEGVRVVEVDPLFYRPVENNKLIGNYSKAKKLLGWEPKIELNKIIKQMVAYDCTEL